MNRGGVGVTAALWQLISLPLLVTYTITWSLTVREEYRERRMFGPERDEVTREWRRLRNKEFYAQHSLPNQVKEARWAEHVERMGRGEVLTEF
jgi:hypothetical protein